MTKRVCALISVVLFSLMLVAGSGAQTTNQVAIDQALSAVQGGTGGTQGLSGSLTGTAPIVSSQQPTVNQLTAAPSPSGQGSGAQTSGGAAQVPAQAVQLSPIEQMFAITASSLGTPTQNLEQFGYSLFQNPATPSLASIGDDYTLGPGDGLVLYLWGDPVDIKELSSSYVLTVDRNGSIFLPAVGQVSVWGQNLGSVKAVLKSMLDRRYKKLEMNLTLSTLRQFPVFVSGYAGAPGTVLANGADTVFTVLSRAGGILKAGSLRSVTLTRQGKGGAAERIEIDFYASLLEGKPIDLRVREGDSIFIPAIGPVVALAGELKRPGIYEIKDEATTGQVLGLAGGLLPSARSKSVSLLRFEAAGKVLRTGDIADKAFAGQAVSDGDFFYFGRVSDLLLGQAQISGAVKYPGRYEVGSFRTLKSLLLKAQPLPETNLYYGRLYRIDQSGRDKSFAFSPRDVLGSAGEVPLFEFDKVVLYRYDDTGTDPDFDRFADTLVVRGPVKYPGFYLYKEGMQLSELLSHNELLLDANHMYAELIRRTANGKYEYFTFAPDSVLSGKTDMALARYDTVNFVKKGEQANNHDFDKFPDAVSLTGNVARPEVYALRPGMKLSDIVTAEQVLLDTNMNYGEMVRLRVDGKNEYVTFRPKEVLEGKYDIALGARDVIRLVKVGYVASAEDVERYKRLVTVEGPVTFGGTYAWVEGMKLSELLGLAKPKLEANGVYAEIVRPIGGGKNEYVTFAPREVAAGVYDTELKARDRVRLYSTVAPKVVGSVQGAAGGTAGGSGAVQGTQGTVASTPAAAGNSGIETDLGFYLEVVYASGTIRYAGPYARTPTLMLSSVVTPDQILQDTNLDYAELTRRKADGSWEYLTFSPREVLEKTYDIPLRAMDFIRFVPVKYLPEKIDFDKFGNAIAIQGAANFPGLYSFSAPKMLSEILTPEQLLSTTDMYYGEIERRQKSGRVDYLTFSPMAVLKGYQDIRIYPRDIIRFVPAGDTGQNHDFSKYPDTVLLKGSIRYPGRYAWYKGMKLSDIVQESDLLIDTETSYAEVRRSSMAGDSIVSFAPGQVVAAQADVELRPRDTVVFYPKYAQRPISIAGEVADPKIVPYYDQIELSSVLRSVTLSQDLTNLKAEIKKASGETTDVYLEDYLKRQPTAKVLLSPGDAITIKALLPDEHLPAVVVRGEVKSPQTLAFTEGMRLSDALAAVGGYASTAYPKGLVLIRKSVAAAQQAQVDRLIAQYEAATAAGAALPSISSSSSTSLSAFAVIANMHVDLAIQKAKLGTLKQLYKEGFGRIALEIPNSLEALKGSSSDIKLERDDLIYVPKMPTYVLVSGEVSSQNVVLYKEGLTVRQAITESGWVLDEADLAHAYIIRVSGKLDSTEGKGFLFFKPNILNYKLEPGDTVYVPTKSSKVSMTWAYLSDAFEIVGTILTTALTAKTLLGL